MQAWHCTDSLPRLIVHNAHHALLVLFQSLGRLLRKVLLGDGPLWKRLDDAFWRESGRGGQALLLNLELLLKQKHQVIFIDILLRALLALCLPQELFKLGATHASHLIDELSV